MMPRRWPRPQGISASSARTPRPSWWSIRGRLRASGARCSTVTSSQSVEGGTAVDRPAETVEDATAAARRRPGSAAVRRCGGPCRRRAARWCADSGRQTRPAGPLAATSARTGCAAGHLDQVADGGGQAGDQHVQAEQLGNAAELERARRPRGRARGERGSGCSREDLPERGRARSSTRRSRTASSDSTIASDGASVGSAMTTTPCSVSSAVAAAPAMSGCRRTRTSIRPGSTASTRRTVSAPGSSARASSRPTSSRVSSQASSDAWASTRADSSVRVSSRRAAASSSAVRAARCSASRRASARGVALRGLVGGETGGLVGLAPSLGPAHGVALRPGCGAGALGERRPGSAR